MNAVLHRLGQGSHALFAFARSPDLALARQFLSPRELAAFQRMSRADQLHSLNVLRALLRDRPDAPRTLAKAALLHDVGKSRCHLAVWQKTLAVLLLAKAPGLGLRFSHKETLDWWRAPFVVRRHHARWSAEILRDIGSEPSVIWLARHHHDDLAHFQDHEHIALLAALQAADSQC